MSSIHSTAEVSSTAVLAKGVRIWHYVHIGEGCIIGENVIIGKSAYVGSGVEIGANCKVQNNALIYHPAEIEEGVFIGPGVILTNDQYPRAINPDGSQKIGEDWELVGVKIRKGASIGAGSICIAPVEIGCWSFIAAGSTVTSDVPPYALMAGTPARRINWVGRAGLPLIDLGAGQFECPKTGQRYVMRDETTLEEVID